MNDILDLAKIEANMLTLEVEAFSMLEKIEEVAALQRPVAEAKGVSVVVEVGNGFPGHVMGDPVRIYQVVSNLLGNAVKFTQSGEVRVRCEVASLGDGERQIRISVSDTGEGIPPDQLEHIFGKFNQADGSNTRRHGGTGLGLAICAQLVERMGGAIGVESELGVGSVFWFTLPFEVEALSERGAPDAVPS